MKTYEAVFEPDKNKGVYGISLVENPAMKGHFIALSENKIEFKTVDEEKRILIGLVLEPNKPIYRNQNGEEFNIVFSEKTIEDLAHGFYKGGFQSNSTLEHSDRINGVTFVESWIVLNENNDKSNELGLKYPKGSWLATMKVDSKDVWDNYVKTGKVKGFSIDALISLKEVNFKSELNMSEQAKTNTLLEKMVSVLMSAFPTKKEEAEVNLGSMKSKDGSVSIMYEGDSMQVGGRVWVVAEDGTEVPLPVGEYELEDGSILVVSQEGVIAEVKAVSTSAPEPQAPAQMQEQGSISEAEAEGIAQAVKSVLIKYTEDNQKVIDELKAELKSTKEELVKLSEQPASKPITSVPTQVDFSKMTPLEKFRFLKNNN